MERGERGCSEEHTDMVSEVSGEETSTSSRDKMSSTGEERGIRS